MNENIIITGGQSDAELLQKLLPDEIVGNSRFISSAGFSSAVSKAKSIAIRLKHPVFLVLDSDTAEHNEAEEKKEQIEYIFRTPGVSEVRKLCLSDGAGIEDLCRINFALRSGVQNKF